MSSDSILAPLGLNNLRAKGLLGPRTPQGTRRMHKRRLNRSSDEENKEIPLDVSLDSPEATSAFAEIPDQLISHATLRYIGFSETKAAELWESWINWPQGGPSREVDPDDGGLQMTFIDFFTGPFDGYVDTWSEDSLEWLTCMDTYGLDPQIQRAITDPSFKHLRLSQSCAYWAKDTVEMRYAGLEAIQRASHEREKKLYQATTSGHPLDDACQSQENPSHSDNQHTSTPGHTRQRSMSGIQREVSSGIEPCSINSAEGVAFRNTPGHTMLYKGLDQARIEGLFDASGAVTDIGTLLSYPPSDFSGTQALFYFTPDYNVAQYYAAYAKRRANCESIVIVCIGIPNMALESLQEPQLQHLYWPSPNWKELIWHDRTGRAEPKHLKKYRQALLIIGNIARKPNKAYRRMGSPERVTQKCLLKVDESEDASPAVQYVFQGVDEGREFLEAHVQHNIKVFPFYPAELQAWIDKHKNLLQG